LFWGLIAIALLPWLPLVVGFEKWQLLPPGVQWSAYLFSIMVIAAALSRFQSPGGSGRERSSRNRIAAEDAGIVPQLGTIHLPSLGNGLQQGHRDRDRQRQPGWQKIAARNGNFAR
jgi:hypothetical protein